MSLSTHNFTFEEPDDAPKITLLPAGKEFPFVILEINEIKQSKAGNPMIPLKLEFDGGQLGKATVYEYLVFQDNMKWKIDAFLKCVAGEAIKAGKQVNFEDPTFLNWLKRQTGTGILKIEPVQGKTYDRNVLDSYVYTGSSKEVTQARANTPPPEPADEVDEDDIPF